MRRLGVPRRLVSAVEGEGLFNDATALVAYRVAVVAVLAGSFSLAEAGLRFVLGAAGGVAIGVVVGRLVAEIRQRTTVAVDTLAAADSSADPGPGEPSSATEKEGPEMDRATLSSCQRPALRSGDRSPSRLERSAVVAVQCHVPRESVGP